MPHANTDEAVCCEGYGPGGAAVMVACRDNLQSVHHNVHERARAVLLRHGGRGGASNSVAYLFHRIGVLRCPDTARLSAVALAAGAEDLLPQADGTLEIITDPAELDSIASQLRNAGFTVLSAAVTRRAAQRLPLDVAAAAQLQHLLTELRALDGVEDVYTNGEIPEQLLARV